MFVDFIEVVSHTPSQANTGVTNVNFCVGKTLGAAEYFTGQMKGIRIY